MCIMDFPMAKRTKKICELYCAEKKVEKKTKYIEL